MGDEYKKLKGVRKEIVFLNNHKGAKPSFLHKTAHRLNTLRATKSKRLRLEYWSRIRYMPNDNCVPTSVVPIDPRLSALYTETSSLVPKANLIKWLMGDEQERNVEVYRDIGGKFDCKAFVSVSQRPDMTALLSSIILQIGRQKSSHSCSMKDLIDSLRESLQHKRYLALI
uniref:Uncharacterized protein n=1 Tax=Oryza nivara TaxID=4536 RepID=A0A0E0I6C6_ORYNI